ncbi:Adenylate cyclase type 10 [Phlyctochytrium planicorne]|nr:Adenylate cyclase type 10 [Phlyctochytrium planicorne]
MRYESLLARRLRLGSIPDLPHAEIEPFGCVAVIDISGYTQLTDRLASLGEVDRIKDVLNPPFEKIIEAVHAKLGSIVKLAGDSAIVTWSFPPGLEESLMRQGAGRDDMESRKRRFLCEVAVECCLELLEEFESYFVRVAHESGGAAEVPSSSPLDEYLSGGGGMDLRQFLRHQRDSIVAEDIRRPSKKRIPDKDMQKLSIHVGLGFGEVHHVFVGALEDSDSERAEYFVAGKALNDAGEMLTRGRAGQFVFDAKALEMYFDEDANYWTSKNRSSEVVLECGTHTFEELKNKLRGNVDEFNEWSENRLPVPNRPDPSRIAFIEHSIAKNLFSEQTTSLDHFNQFRAITALFIRFPHIPIDRIASSSRILDDVAFVADQVMRIVARNGGTCRQIHADEKSLSVLAIWGVEGFSHEKGDHVYALAAGMELLKVMKGRRWWFHDLDELQSGDDGIEGKVQLLMPTKLKDANVAYTYEQAELKGRENELLEIASVVSRWQTSGERATVLVIGKSGFGKTALVKSYLANAEMDPDWLICFGAARENRNDANYIYQQILLSLYLQMSRRGISGDVVRKPQQLQETFPLVFGEPQKSSKSDKVIPTMTDSVTFLVVLILTILESLDKMKLKAILVLDDAQWMDSSSFETTCEIILKCPAVLVIFTSRPREEYSPTLQPYFDRISSFACCKTLTMQRLSSKSIEKLVVYEMNSFDLKIEKIAKSLLDEIIEKSQGNPMVIKLLCKFLSTSSMVVVSNGILKRSVTGSSDKGGDGVILPINASAAVASGLDKLAPNIQMMLRIASAAGQFFTLDEVTHCYSRIHIEASKSAIAELIYASQKQGIVAAFADDGGDRKDIFSFHHYLIYQGVYQSLLQSRREEIHRVYAEYYQDLFESTANHSLLSGLLHHLLKLPGEESRKKRFVRVAMKTFADLYRPVEGRMYHEILKDLEKIVPDIKTPFHLGEELRLIALIERESGNYGEAAKLFYESFAAHGFVINIEGPRKAAVIRNSIRSLLAVTRIVQMDGVERYVQSLLTLHAFFRNSFAKIDVSDFVKAVRRRNAIPELADSIQQHREMFEVIIELRWLCISALAMLFTYGRPGTGPVLVTLLLFLTQVMMADESNIEGLAASFVSVACIYSKLGKEKLANRLFQDGRRIFGPARHYEMSRQGFYILFNYVISYFVCGEVEACLSACDLYLELGAKVYSGSVPATHQIRLKKIISLNLLGELHTSNVEIIQSLKEVYGEFSILPLHIMLMLHP